MIDERSLRTLRSKLEALNYKETVDASSAPLVQKLLDDLINSRQDYVHVKQQAGRHAYELHGADDKLNAILQDAARQQEENSQLHINLIQEAEKHDQQEKQHYQQLKRLEDKIAELSYWKQAASEKLLATERENSSLRRKIDGLVKLTDKLSTGSMDPQAVTAKISASPPITPSSLPSPAKKGAGTIDALQAANARIASLQQQLANKTQELAEVQDQLATMQEAVRRRDTEIMRLGTRAGVDPEVVNLAARNESHENMILQLNQTVDVLNSQLHAYERQSEDRQRVESALAFEQRARAEAEDRLSKAVAENNAIEREVERLRADMATMHSTSTRANALAATEVDTALNSVSALRQRLAEARGDQDRMRSLLDSVTSERAAATSNVAALQREVEALRQALAEMQGKAEEAQRLAQQYKYEAEGRAETLSATQAALSQAQQQAAGVQVELEERRVMGGKVEVERQQALARLEELQRRLEAVEATASSERGSNVQLASRLSKAEGELRVKSIALGTAEAELQVLHQQLQDIHEARVKAQGALGSADEERARLQHEAALLAGQLKEDRAELECANTAKRSLELEAGRLKSEVSILSTDKAMLEEQLAACSSRLAEGQTAWSSAARELSGLQGLPSRFEELQQQVHSYVGKLAAAEGEVSRLRSEAARAGHASERAEAEVAELRRALVAEREAVASLRLQLTEAEQGGAAAAAAVRQMEGERDRLLAEHRAASSELHALRERLNHEESSAQELDVAAKDLHLRLAAAQRQLAAKDEECDGLQRMLEQAQRNAEGARQREEETRQQSRTAAERSRRAEALCQEHEADVQQLRAARENDQLAIRRLEEANLHLRQQVEARRKEVEQLTTLSLRGDSTVQEYMANLKAMSSELRAAEMRMQDLVSELSQRDDELHRTRLERDDLRRVVAGLDADRDNLQAEMDHKAEQLAVLSADLNAKQKQIGEVSRLLSMAEGRLNHADAHAHETGLEATALREQLGSALDNLHGLAAEHDAVRAELRAAHEDLEALVRENQAVGSELAAAAGQRDNAIDELRRVSTRLAAAEQLVRAKEAEVEDLRKAYEGLALALRRAESTAAQLEREGGMREAALSSRADEIASLQEANRAAQAQNNQYVMDLQAFERQADALSRQLAKAEAEAEDRVREREVMLEEMRAAQQVRLALERQREDLQRQLAAMDSQLAITHARLEDAGSEASSLSQRLALERNRVTELEALLAGMRAREYRSDMSSTKSGSQLAIMQERNRILEEQVTTLQHQVQELQQSRDAQDRELGRLRTEALALAASTSSLEQQSHEGLVRLQQDTHAAEARAKELASALRSMQSERDHLASRLESLGIQAQADTAALRQQLDVAMEGRAALGRELAAARQASSGQLPVPPSIVSGLEHQVADLRSEIVRLEQLVAALENERSSLQQELAVLRGRLQGGGGARSSGGGAALEQLQSQISRLQAQLKDEQQKRRQAERDFLDLMESIEQADLGGQGPDGAQALASKRLGDLQTKLEALETEKMALEDNTAKTAALMQAMQSELKHIHKEYGVASSTLQEMAQGMGPEAARSVASSTTNTPAAGRGAWGQAVGDGTWGSSGGGKQ